MIFIEQDKEHARFAIAFHTHANIEEIRLVAARVKCSMSSEEVAFPLESSFKFRPDDHVVKDRKVRIGTRFRFDVTTSDNGPRRAVFSVECKFEADYELREGYTPSDEQIAAFKDANAIFNSWPFFREFLHSTVTRMGYPAPTVPFLRIVPKVVRSKVPAPPQIEAPEKELKRKKKPRNF